MSLLLLFGGKTVAVIPSGGRGPVITAATSAIPRGKAGSPAPSVTGNRPTPRISG